MNDPGRAEQKQGNWKQNLRQGLGFPRKQELWSGQNETGRKAKSIFRRVFEVVPVDRGLIPQDLLRSMQNPSHNQAAQ